MSHGDRVIQLSEDEYLRHRDDYDGCCAACGEWTIGGVEPDAQNYECDACGIDQVFGAEQLLLMGKIEFMT